MMYDLLRLFFRLSALLACELRRLGPSWQKSTGVVVMKISGPAVIVIVDEDVYEYRVLNHFLSRYRARTYTQKGSTTFKRMDQDP